MASRKRRTHAILVMVALVAWLPSVSASADESVLAPLQGEWELDRSERDQDARRAAIDAAVASLSWVMRMFAGPILHRDTAPPDRLLFFASTEGWFQRAIARDLDRLQPIQLGAAPHRHIDPQGGDFQAVWKATEAGVELHWEQSQAVGSNRYHVDPDTGQLVLRQTIQVTEISDLAPIVLESRFDRRDRSSLASEMSTGG